MDWARSCCNWLFSSATEACSRVRSARRSSTFLPTRVPVGCPGVTPSGLKLPLLSCWGLLLAVSVAAFAALVVDAVWVDVLGLAAVDPCALVEALWPVFVHADRTKSQPAM